MSFLNTDLFYQQRHTSIIFVNGSPRLLMNTRFIYSGTSLVCPRTHDERQNQWVASKWRVMKHFLLQGSGVTHTSSTKWDESRNPEQAPSAETFFPSSKHNECHVWQGLKLMSTPRYDYTSKGLWAWKSWLYNWQMKLQKFFHMTDWVVGWVIQRMGSLTNLYLNNYRIHRILTASF